MRSCLAAFKQDLESATLFIVGPTQDIPSAIAYPTSVVLDVLGADLELAAPRERISFSSELVQRVAANGAEGRPNPQVAPLRKWRLVLEPQLANKRAGFGGWPRLGAFLDSVVDEPHAQVLRV